MPRWNRSRSIDCAMVDFPAPERPVNQITAPRWPIRTARSRAVIFSSVPKIFLLFDGSIGINATENRAATADLVVVDDNKASQIRNPVVIIYDEWRAGL